MSEPLFTTDAGGVTLTDRQAHALRTIREQQPIRSDALGAHLHAYRQANGGRGHHAYETCDWCVSEAKSVGDALAKRGLVRYVRGQGWVTGDYEAPKAASSQLGVGDEWPEDLF